MKIDGLAPLSNIVQRNPFTWLRVQPILSIHVCVTILKKLFHLAHVMCCQTISAIIHNSKIRKDFWKIILLFWIVKRLHHQLLPIKIKNLARGLYKKILFFFVINYHNSLPLAGSLPLSNLSVPNFQHKINAIFDAKFLNLIDCSVPLTVSNFMDIIFFLLDK